MNDTQEDFLDLTAQHFSSIAEVHHSAERAGSKHQRFLERIIQAVGRPILFYALVALACGWIALNLRLGRGAFDPSPFALLQLIMTSLATFIAALVLIAENRISRSDREREYLDLQINLLSEHKITKVIALLEELRRDMPNVHDRHDAEADAMTSTIDPKAVVDQLRDTADDKTPGLGSQKR